MIRDDSEKISEILRKIGSMFNVQSIFLVDEDGISIGAPIIYDDNAYKDIDPMDLAVFVSASFSAGQLLGTKINDQGPQYTLFRFKKNNIFATYIKGAILVLQFDINKKDFEGIYNNIKRYFPELDKHLNFVKTLNLDNSNLTYLKDIFKNELGDF